jgi:DNA replication and repair protein RecF
VITTDITLRDYRNWPALTLQPHPRLNVIVGANAQGKSNLLEALYALVTTRPYRALKDVEVIRFQAEVAHVSAGLAGGGRSVHCAIAWEKLNGSDRTRKVVQINQQPVHRLVDVFGVARMVLFAPQDLELMNGGPETRRRFLDVLLSQLQPAYLHALHVYQKVLAERNRWLRAAAVSGHADAGLREAYNEQMVRCGSELIVRRARAIDVLGPLLERIYHHLSGARETVRLLYLCSTPPRGDEDVAAALSRALASRAHEELARGTTVCGPHRDDLGILLNGHPIRSFGSQGQQRSMAVALRLAEGEMLEREGGEPPVLLLDDCLSEIDESRQQALWEYLAERQQVFLTTCNWQPRALPVDGTTFLVADGQAREHESIQCCA